MYAVHCVMTKLVNSLSLHNLFGEEGDKWVTGGILVRRASGW